MTDPAGGAPTPPPSEPTPPPTTPPAGAPAPPPSSWQAPAPQSQGFGTATIAAGPAPGVSYADTTMRVIAYIIDSILLGIVIALVAIILIGIMVGILSTGFAVGLIILVVVAIIALLGSAFYFVYFWTTLRASPGQKILGLETVNAADGATLTRDQAVRRWAFLFGPQTVANVFSFAGSASSTLGWIGSLLGLLAFLYAIYLLYTVTQSSKRQGFHDVQAATVVVKRG